MQRRSLLKAFAASIGLSAVPASAPAIAAAPSTNGAPTTIAEMLSRCESIGNWFPVAAVSEFDGASVLVNGVSTPALTYAAFGWTEAEAVGSLWEALTDVLRGNESPSVYWRRYPTLKTVTAREEYRDNHDYLVHLANPYFVASMRLTTTPDPKRTPYLKAEGERVYGVPSDLRIRERCGVARDELVYDHGAGASVSSLETRHYPRTSLDEMFLRRRG